MHGRRTAAAFEVAVGAVDGTADAAPGDAPVGDAEVVAPRRKTGGCTGGRGGGVGLTALVLEAVGLVWVRRRAAGVSRR